MAGRPSSTRPPVSKGRATNAGPARSARGRPRARSSSIKPHRALDELQDQCTELKCLINKTTEDNLRARTRLMALDKELNKRERLLQTMVKLNQAGVGLGLDLVEKLKEERNMLPLYRRKAQDLQQQIEERENDQKAMKRDPFFTRIIELQIEYVSWKQEASRLESLLSEPSPEANPAAKQEVDVHQQRLEKLKEALTAAQGKREQVAEELQDMQDEHADCQRRFEENKEALTREQEATRDIAVSFKQLLQDRKEAERLQAEIQEMAAARRRHEEELAALLEHQAAEEAKGTQLPAGGVPPAAVSREMEQSLVLLKRAMRREATPSLSQALRLADRDEDGHLTVAELEEAMTRWQGCPLDATEAATMMFALCARTGEASEKVRWPMVLDVLQRGGDEVDMNREVPLPPLRPLRWACLRSRMASEELARQIQAISSLPDAQALFGGSLPLAPQDAASWIKAWQHLGSRELHAQLPAERAAMSHAGFSAWSARVRGAVAKNREGLTKSFTVWRSDMLLTPEQFRMICSRDLSRDLDAEDVDDLFLFSSPSFPPDDQTEAIDGNLLLQQFAS